MKCYPSSLPAASKNASGEQLFDNEKRLMTVAELAARLNVSRSHVYVLMNEHGLPRVKLGRAARFRWDEVEVWLRDRSFT